MFKKGIAELEKVAENFPGGGRIRSTQLRLDAVIAIVSGHFSEVDAEAPLRSGWQKKKLPSAP